MAEPSPDKTTPSATAGAELTETTETPEAGSSSGGNAGHLQPPQHWTEQVLDESDTDSALGDDNATSTASISSSILKYRTINGRTYHSDRGNNQYWGANDDLQNNTLDIQHHVFTLSQDGKLYYAPLAKDIQKAIDIGTGTGLWVIDFADEHPDTEVIGTDLSPIQPTWVPPNVKFEIDDYLLPWTFTDSSIDYVHMRWLIGTIVDWPELFRNAYRVLKPGGWIESFECNGYFESDDDTVQENTAHAQWGYIFREGMRKLGSKAPFTVVRDNIQRKALEEVGFVNIHEKPIQVPTSEWSEDPKLRDVGLFSRAAIENDTEGAVGLLARALGWTPTEIKVYAMHMRKELRALKVHAFYRSNVVWAQKPLE